MAKIHDFSAGSTVRTTASVNVSEIEGRRRRQEEGESKFENGGLVRPSRKLRQFRPSPFFSLAAGAKSVMLIMD